MTEDERLERIQLALTWVPHSLYDEVTKLAENALGEFIRERDDLADALRRIADNPTARPSLAKDQLVSLARAALDRHIQGGDVT